MADLIARSEMEPGCSGCRAPLDFDFTFAFQPIVDVIDNKVFGYEALVRGPEGQGAGEVLSQVNDDNRYAFDQACRVKAIELAARLGLKQKLSINFLPNAVYSPEHCIRSTLAAAHEYGLPVEQIMFEITESERVHDTAHLTRIFQYYRAQGFTTALDDFGAGHAGLNLLAGFIPHILKLDMELIRDIDRNEVKQVIVEGLLQICSRLGITPLAEGIETSGEMEFFRARGVRLMQGYYFARPGFETLPGIQSESD
ncbi:EAL domain-containing protein [Marinobacterium sediminicola]|uniref:EAL domain, c-di-GMP-specific phosphodiesterase class I (Or its enzymatically inactive variant) n=1 Tax=Marinobacterium sediminicola TaxID=518898 RepID=A0ABY1RVY0_9GAMM|nr:EAL domain-containing protein [Marinobacterium sediminicola]ULG70513.1 EAL domain-containing protein [Marinobacterium sediminicola]SMR69125.1 EAL domain, c-di-GMP-specific phosphodiesterase class I (or its enzymatically inactive variant) [Marinobacterium sediminicola]